MKNFKNCLVVVLLLCIGGCASCSQRTAKPADECIGFSPVIGGSISPSPSPSMSLARGKDGCYVKLNKVKFYQTNNCTGTGKSGLVKKDIGDVVCSSLSGGCRECILKTKNSPYIIEFWNGTGMVSYCYDFDGPNQDCNLTTGTECLHSAQCTSGKCSGGTCQ